MLAEADLNRSHAAVAHLGIAAHSPRRRHQMGIVRGRVVLSRIANSLNLRLSALLDGGLGFAAFLGLNIRVHLRRDHREQIINLFPNRLR